MKAENGEPLAVRFELSKFLSRLAAWATLVVAVMYAVGRLLAEVYYREFGIGATSAGLETADLVGQAAGSAIWLVVLSTPGLVQAGIYARRGAPPFWDSRRWRPTSLAFYAVDSLFTFAILAVPAAAVYWFIFRESRLTRVDDFGIPLASIAMSFVAIGAAQASGARTRELADAAASKGQPKLSGVEAFERNKRARRYARRSLVLGTLFGLFGLGIGVVGVLQQADDVKKARAEQPAPWSLAPGFTEVVVYGPAEETSIPAGCLMEIGRGGSVWVFWDPRGERLWRTSESVELGNCEEDRAIAVGGHSVALTTCAAMASRPS
jgi:hypothetical protein